MTTIDGTMLLVGITLIFVFGKYLGKILRFVVYLSLIIIIYSLVRDAQPNDVEFFQAFMGAL